MDVGTATLTATGGLWISQRTNLPLGVCSSAAILPKPPLKMANKISMMFGSCILKMLGKSVNKK